MSHVSRRTEQDVGGRPQPIKDVLAELITRRGYAREHSSAALESAWKQVAGEFLAAHSRCGQIRRGVLEVFMANSILVQEITFRKAALAQELAGLLPETQIKEIKFRVGQVR